LKRKAGSAVGSLGFTPRNAKEFHHDGQQCIRPL
jgi:hypothetical protein